LGAGHAVRIVQHRVDVRDDGLVACAQRAALIVVADQVDAVLGEPCVACALEADGLAVVAARRAGVAQSRDLLGRLGLGKTDK
jgi:hypothetical protein